MGAFNGVSIFYHSYPQFKHLKLLVMILIRPMKSYNSYRPKAWVLSSSEIRRTCSLQQAGQIGMSSSRSSSMGSFHALLMWAVASFGCFLFRFENYRAILTIKIFAAVTVKHMTSSVSVKGIRLSLNSCWRNS